MDEMSCSFNICFKYDFLAVDDNGVRENIYSLWMLVALV